MALAKQSSSFDEYSIEKHGKSVRLEKSVGLYDCSFCGEETNFYDVTFEDNHWSVNKALNMSHSARRMSSEEIEEMERLQVAVTRLKVKHDLAKAGPLWQWHHTRPHALGPYSGRPRLKYHGPPPLGRPGSAYAPIALYSFIIARARRSTYTRRSSRSCRRRPAGSGTRRACPHYHKPWRSAAPCCPTSCGG